MFILFPPPPQKHVYSSIATREQTEEEESSGKAEATYMTMVRALLGAAGPGVQRMEKELARMWQCGWVPGGGDC